MARIRTVKPEFFYSEQVGQVSHSARLLFIGLWTIADREGRLRWQPRKIRAQVFPYEEQLQIYAIAEELVTTGLLWLYETDEGLCGVIPGFVKHQRPHPKEPASELPPPPDGQDLEGVLPWRPSVEQVYFVRNTETGAVKIGRSKRVAVRIKELQTGSHVGLELICAVTGDSEKEKSLQRELANFRLSGEWFRDCPEVQAVIDREKTRPKILLPETKPPFPVEVRVEGKGREGDLGREGVSAPPPLVRKRKPFNHYEGERIEVPQKWHDEHVRMLGLDDADAKLQAWYEELDAQLVRSRAPVGNWFKWLDACYAPWATDLAADMELEQMRPRGA